MKMDFTGLRDSLSCNCEIRLTSRFLLPSHISSLLTMTPASCSSTTFFFIITTIHDCWQSGHCSLWHVGVLHTLPDKLGCCSCQCFCRRLYRWQSRCGLNPLEGSLCVLSSFPLFKAHSKKGYVSWR